jgi:predicted small integral membrane protein
MWKKIKWGLAILALVVAGLFLHYTLPQRDVVQVINTYNRLTQIGGNWMFYAIEDTGTGVETTATSRDIRFIDVVFPDGSTTMTYRNEDTGWLWPPYFKWNSSTLQAQATNLQSDKANPQWVAVTHYGWRMPLFSIFPNAVSIRPVDGPDVRLIPWINIIILSALAFLIFMIRKMWLQFRERMVDPALVEVGETFDAAGQRVDAARKEARGFFGRIGAWFGTWRAKK